MALDIKGFVTPEQQFEGLYKLSDMAAKQKAEKQKQEEEKKANKASLSQYLSEYINPKNFQTKTVYDQIITKGVYDLNQEANEFIAKNPTMDKATLIATFSPKISQLATTSEKVKEIERQRASNKAILAKNPSVDLTLFDDNYTKNAYYNQDGSLKAFSDIDDQKDYGNDVINNTDIYTEQGFNLFSKAQPKDVFQEGFETRDSKGNVVKGTKELKIASYLQPIRDKNNKIIDAEPKHDLFTNEGIEQIHEYMGDDGSIKTQPIKVVTDEVFDMVINDNTLAPKIRAVTKKYSDQYGYALDSPQSEAFAKAIAYQMLDRHRQSGINFTTRGANKAPLPQRSTIFNFNYGDGGGANGGYTGNVLDEVGFDTPKVLPSGQNINIKDGKAKDDKGKNFDGVVEVSPDEVPEKIRGVIYDNASGYNFFGPKGRVELRFKNGQIEGIRYKKDDAKKSTEIKRSDFEDWLQIKASKSSEKSGKDPSFKPARYGKKTPPPSDKGWAD